MTDDTDCDSHHGDSSHGDSGHGDGGHGNEANTELDLSDERAQSLKRKIGSFKVVKGLEPALDEVDVKEASVGMATDLVAKEKDITIDTTKTAELAILALHKEHKQKHAERKERERGKRKSHEVITREKLEISRPRSLVGEPRTRSRSTGDLDTVGKQKRLVKKQYSLPVRARSLKLAQSTSSELDFDERAESPLFDNDNNYPPGVLKGGLISSLRHLEESRERRDSGTPLFKQPSIKQESESKKVAEVELDGDRAAGSEKNNTFNLEPTSIPIQKDKILESETPSQASEVTSRDLQQQCPGTEDTLTAIIQVDRLPQEESPSLRRTLSTVKEENTLLENKGSFSIPSRGSSNSQDKKVLAEEVSSVSVGSDASSNSNVGMIECGNTPNADDTKLKEWELKNEIWDDEKSGSQTSSEGVGMTTPISIHEGISKQDHQLSKSAPTNPTNYPQSPSNNGGLKTSNSSLESVQLRQMKITRAKRKWLSQSAVVTSGLPQSSDVKLTSFRKNGGETDVPDSGAPYLQTSKSPGEENNHAKENTKQVTFGKTPVGPEHVTPGEVTPKRPPRKGKLSPSASFASPSKLNC